MKELIAIAILYLGAISSHAEENKWMLSQGWDDIEPRDYSHLAIKLPEIKPEDNALHELSEMSEKLEELTSYGEKIFANTSISPRMRKGRAKKAYEKIKGEYDKIDTLLKRKHLYEEIEFTFSASSPKTIQMISFSRFLQLRTLILHDEGRYEDAYHSLLKEIELSKKLKKDCYTLVCILVVQAVDAGIVDSADHLLRDADQTTRMKILGELRKNLIQPKHMKVAMQGEFLAALDTLKAFSTGNFDSLDGMDVAESLSKVNFWDAVCSPHEKLHGKYIQIMAYKHYASLFYQPNKTAEVFYQDWMKREKLLGVKPHQLKKMAKELRENEKKTKTNLKQVSSNFLGNAIAALSSPLINRQIGRMYVSHAAIDLLELRDALRRYRKDKGSYPEQLENLVPLYLSKIPVDIYAPGRDIIQYDGEKIWSVGMSNEKKFDEGHHYYTLQEDHSRVGSGLDAYQPYMLLPK